jgi:hypothetical protein
LHIKYVKKGYVFEAKRDWMEFVPESAQTIFLDLAFLGFGIAVRKRSYCFAAVIG